MSTQAPQWMQEEQWDQAEQILRFAVLFCCLVMFLGAGVVPS